jgi:type IV pilus assembly protein PilW
VNYHKCKNSLNNNGFTLLELLIVMAITGIVMAAVYSASKTQQDSYIAQEEVATMQQNVRSAMYYMEREIRMAGYDPSSNTNAGFLTAGPNSVNFTLDLNDNGSLGDPNENITFGFSSANDANFDGIADAGGATLGRNTGGGFQPIADNVHAVGFAYAFDNNNDAQLDTNAAPDSIIWAIDSDGDGRLDTDLDTNDDGNVTSLDNPAGTAMATTAGIQAIRAVQIWLLVRTGRTDKSMVDTRTYVVGNKRITPAGNDRLFKYRILNCTITCRNMGL